jgi:LysM repeat protein
MLVLVGCYRQAGDEFEQVDSENVQQVVASPTVNMAAVTPMNEPTLNPIILSLTVDVTDDGSGQASGVDAQPTNTESPAGIMPTLALTNESTPALPVTNLPDVIPTATTIGFVTPEPPPGQVVQPTIVAPTATPTQDLTQPTATEIGVVTEPDECTYEVMPGNNLFRIAINNNTTVEEIQRLNNLQSDNIQPGQLLRIPNCVPDTSPTDAPSTDTTTVIAPTDATGGSSIATIEPADNLPSAGQQIHVVISGDTLGSIANRYNTTIAEIVEINGLVNPNALDIGQEILIPASN